MSRVFITGSADGLGKMAAQLLIKRGHRVVLHTRNAKRAKDALAAVPPARFLKSVLGEWEVSGVLTLQSGLPFTVVDGLGGSAYGLSSPNLVTPDFAPGYTCSNAYSSGDVESRLSGFLNPKAFVNAPAVGSDDSSGLGTIGRNCFRGPSQNNLDFSLSKMFRIGERQSLKFTTEFFNFTNTPSFAKSVGKRYE